MGSYLGKKRPCEIQVREAVGKTEENERCSVLLQEIWQLIETGECETKKERCISLLLNPEDINWHAIKHLTRETNKDVAKALHSYLTHKVGNDHFECVLSFSNILPDTATFPSWPAVDLRALDVIYQGLCQLNEELSFVLDQEENDSCDKRCLDKIRKAKDVVTAAIPHVLKMYEDAHLLIPVYVSWFNPTQIDEDLDAFIAQRHPKIPTLKSGTSKTTIRDAVLLRQLHDTAKLLHNEVDVLFDNFCPA